MNNKLTNKAVFLDRDGIINHVVYHKGINKPSSPWNIKEFRLIKGIEKPLEEISKMGFLIFIVSNQPDISRGNIKKGVNDEINRKILGKFPIKEIKICPHDDKDNCNCRKPKPGMITELSKKWNIDLKKSFLIGDSWKDIKAAENAGVKSILIIRDYNNDVRASFRIKNLKEFLELTKK